MTRWATASCVAMIPTEPAAPRISSVSPGETLSCFTPTYVPWLGSPRGDERIFAVAAKTELECGDFIPNLYARDRRPERVDDTSHLEPENRVGWKPPHGREIATPDLRIGRTNPGGLDSNAHLAGARLRHCYLAPDKDFRRSVLGQDNGFWHVQSPWSALRTRSGRNGRSRMRTPTAS